MEQIKDDTIGAFNAYLSGLQSEDSIEFTLVQFDSQSLDKVCVAVPVKQAEPLTKATFQPRASTPLIDAAYKTIKAVEQSLNGDGKTKVVICIQTDGQENSSTEHTWADLNAIIKEKTALGWQFNFMGAGIDAYEQGSRMGIAQAATMSYDHKSGARTASAFKAAASNTTAFASGLAASTDFSSRQRLDAGDRFAKDPLDLKAPQSPPATPKPKSARKPAVDNFTL